MRRKPILLRGTVAVIMWAGVTTIAAIGSWLGLSSVFTAVRPGTTADTVAAEQSVSPSATVPSPSESTSSSDETLEATTEPPPEQWNGWTPIGDGIYERSFDTEGGTAVVQLEPGTASFVSASPAEGYTATTQWPEPNRLVITFYTSGSTVIIDTMWWNDEPYSQVSKT